MNIFNKGLNLFDKNLRELYYSGCL